MRLVKCKGTGLQLHSLYFLRNYIPNLRNSFFLNSEGVQPLMALNRLEILLVSNSSILAAISVTESLLESKSWANRSIL